MYQLPLPFTRRLTGIALPLPARLLPNFRPPHVPATTLFLITNISVVSYLLCFYHNCDERRTNELLAIPIRSNSAVFASLVDKLDSPCPYLLDLFNVYDHYVCYCRDYDELEYPRIYLLYFQNKCYFEPSVSAISAVYPPTR